MNNGFQSYVIDLLERIPPHIGWMVAWLVALATAILYSARYGFARDLQPPLTALEFVRSPAAAMGILDRWGDRGKRGARNAIVRDFFFILLYTALSVYVCLWAAISVRRSVPWLAVVEVIVAGATLTAVLFGWVEDVALLKTIRGGRKSVVVARVCAWMKYCLLGLAVPFIFFRMEYFVYNSIERNVGAYPVFAITALVLLSLLAGAWMLRMAAMLYPPLLLLELAPSISEANRVIARWGPERRERAVRANYVDTVFAVLYPQALASICFHLAVTFATPIWAVVSRSVGWYMILAGTCHVAQNCGVHFALRQGRMGWWLGICRFCGQARASLLFVGGLWLGLLYLVFEARVVTRVLALIRDARWMEFWPG